MDTSSVDDQTSNVKKVYMTLLTLAYVNASTRMYRSVEVDVDVDVAATRLSTIVDAFCRRVALGSLENLNAHCGAERLKTAPVSTDKKLCFTKSNASSVKEPLSQNASMPNPAARNAASG